MQKRWDPLPPRYVPELNRMVDDGDSPSIMNRNGGIGSGVAHHMAPIAMTVPSNDSDHHALTPSYSLADRFV